MSPGVYDHECTIDTEFPAHKLCLEYTAINNMHTKLIHKQLFLYFL